MTNLEIIVLAAGKGTRMRSDKSKVLHRLAGKAMIDHVLDSVLALNPARVHVVLGHLWKEVEQHLIVYQKSRTLHQPLHTVRQEEQLGTADAVKQLLPHLNANAEVLIVYGDVPLVCTQSLKRLIAQVQQNTIGLMTVELADPKGYGRIVRNQQSGVSEVIAIVEEQEADTATQQITEVNTGILALPAKVLLALIPQISNVNAKGEFYLTDIIGLAVEQHMSIRTIQPEQEMEVQGVNNFVQLAQLERVYQGQQAVKLMQAGVHLADPARFDLRGTLQHGKDVFVDVNVILEGDVSLGSNVVIEANCVIRDSVIGDDCCIRANSLIEGSKLAKECVIGPFARLRPGSQLADGVKIGNFVETKNADIGQGAKVNHLAYMGDITIGQQTNVGAGAIHCNYDGKQKHYSYIGEHSFVGSNTALIGPVRIGSHALLAAGSVINKNVPDRSLAIARKSQQNIDMSWKKGG